MAYSITTVLGAIGNTSAAIAGLITATTPGQYLPAVLILGSLALVAKQLQAVYTPDKVPSLDELLHKSELLKGASEEVQNDSPENKPKEGLQ